MRARYLGTSGSSDPISFLDPRQAEGYAGTLEEWSSHGDEHHSRFFHSNCLLSGL
jgi:hypothetical protein